MSSSEKRYRFQVQFDIYSDSDKDAVQRVKDVMDNMFDTKNDMIIYMAENYFASLENRVIDHEQIELELFDEREARVKDIMENLPF